MEKFEADDLQKAVECLKKGGVILYPTDTIWGLGCDATNPKAIEKIYEIKKRRENKAMLVLVDSEGMLQKTVQEIPEIAWELIDAAVNPLTIIYDNVIGVADSIKGEDGSVGVRVTTESFSNSLCRALRKPVVSTSANISGDQAPANYKDISEDIKEKVDYIVNYKRDSEEKNKPSNIIKLSDGGLFKVIR